MNWTVIYDPEMVLFASDEESAYISESYDVCSIIIQGTSGTYDFHNYSEWTKTRNFLSVDGAIVEDMGECLTVENYITPVTFPRRHYYLYCRDWELILISSYGSRDSSSRRWPNCT